MKIEVEKREIHKSGDFPQKTFGIAATAQAFEILTSRIYTDVPLAIVRELSTNAFDSHVQAGNQDEPFDVHLPNTLEPWFKIRDYGTGLSPEDVEVIYSTFFASNRDDSDDYVGCMGLGSKSPFAYTDQFTVISYWNGEAFTFACFKGDGGAPSIAIIDRQETSERNGLCVHVPIEARDFGDFRLAAEKVYRYFDPRPNVTGASVNLDMPDPIYEEDSFAVYVGTSNPGKKLSVLMGNVCYEADTMNFRYPFSWDISVILKVGIGECDISASREELQYTDKTKKTVNDLLDLAKEKVAKFVEKELEKHDCEWEKKRQALKFGRLAGVNYSRSIRVSNHDALTIKLAGIYGGYGKAKRLHITNDDTISLDKIPHFILDDVDKITQKYKRRIRYYMEQKGLNDAILVTIEDHSYWKKIFGKMKPEISVSDLPDVPRTYSKNPNGVNRSFVKEFTGNHRVSYAWKTPKQVEPNGAVAVAKEGNYVLWQGGKFGPYEVWKFAKQLGYSVMYGVTEKKLSKFIEEHKIPSLKEEVEKAAKKVKTKYNVFEWSKTIHNNVFARGNVGEWVKHISGLSRECDNFVKLVDANQVKSNDLNMMRACGIEKPSVPNFWEEFLDKYPMIRYVDMRRIPKEFVLDYIKKLENK